VKLLYSLDGQLGFMWLGLGPKTVDKFDGLWKRQVRSTTKIPKEGAVLQLEIAQLGIPVHEVSNYTQPGAVIELEAPVSDYVTLRVGNKPWLMARLCLVGERFALEMTSRTPTDVGDQEGFQRVSIRLGDCQIDVNSLSEGSQAGAVLETPLKVSNEVKLVSNNAVIAKAELQVYGETFALTVVE
jgi:flagellar motor switch/type III secretory pathway protein FliN